MRSRNTLPPVFCLWTLLQILPLTHAFAQAPMACPVTMKEGTRLEEITSYPSYITSLYCDQEGKPWNTPTLGRWSDDRYATVEMDQMEQTECLILSDFNMHIPPGSEIQGIELWIEGHVQGAGVRADKIRLINAEGMPMSANMAKTSVERDWGQGKPGEDHWWHYGGKSNNWGIRWTAEEVNDPDFGVMIRLRHPYMDTATIMRIDDVRLKVYFTPINRVCNDSCAAFIVDPLPEAYGYFWELPIGAYINSNDPYKNAITINTQDLEDGVHTLCVRTMTMFGLSEACCLPFLKEECSPNSIGDRVWEDLNNNGLQDPGEPGVPNVTVRLMNARKNRVIQETATDSSGHYAFEDIPFGLYYISFDIPNGYTHTLPAAGNDPSADSDITGWNGPGTTRNFYLAMGEYRRDLDAGLHIPCSADAGSYDQAPIPLPCLADTGYALRLSPPSDAHLPTGYTARLLLVNTSNGAITAVSNRGDVWITSPGIWEVYNFVYQPARGTSNYFDLQRIVLNQTTITEVKEIIAREGICADISTGAVSVSAESCGTIRGIIWEDLDEGGLRDANEPVVAGVAIQLRDDQGVLVDTQTTTATGSYAFENLPSGNYQITITPPTGYSFTAKDQQANDLLDSDVDTQGHSPFLLILGDTQDIDAGIISPCTAEAGTLHPDPLSVPCYSGGSFPLAATPDGNAVIPNGYTSTYLLVNDHNIIAQSSAPSFQVNASGEYAIYRLVSHPDTRHRGYIDISALTQGNGSIDGVDSLIQAGEICADITDSGAPFSVRNCGFIAGRVWHDTNEDGVQNSNETGVEQIVVHLLKGGSQDTLQSTMTGNDGIYFFPSLIPGQYLVQVEAPNGWLFSPKDATGDASDSDVDAGGRSDALPLTIGQQVIVAAGIFSPCPLGNSPVTIHMASPSTPCIDSTTVVLSASSQPDTLVPGVRRIYLLGRDDYFIADTSSSPSFSTIREGLYRIWSLQYSENSTSDSTFMETFYTPGMQVQALIDKLDSAYVCYRLDSSSNSVKLSQCGHLGNFVWADHNLNGLQDPGEEGMNGVRVFLMDTSQQRIAQTVTTNHPVTGEKGYYSLRVERPGDYYLRFEGPDHLVFTKPGLDTDHERDSDINHSYGFGTTAAIHLSAGMSRDDIDAGMIDPLLLPGQIGDYIWLDSDEDGVQDDFETGINGIPVYLYSAQGELLARDTTKYDNFFSPGHYEFDSILSGTYYIVFDKPDIYQITRPYSSPTPGKGSMITGILADGATDMFVVGAAQARMDIDGGFVQVASVGDRVWADTNADGIQDSSEVGINGIEVLLFDRDSNLVDRSTTHRDSLTGTEGYYLFDHIVPGGYFIQINLPTEYQFSPSEVGGNDALDSDITHTNGPGTSAIFHLSPGEHERDIDAGIYMSSTLGSHVWVDDNGDGMRDNSEEGLEDIPVYLYDTSGVMQSQTATNANGVYWFESVPAGAYYVKVDAPNFYQFTKHDPRHPKMNSDITHANGAGTTDRIDVGPHEMIMHIDAGLRPQLQLASYFERFDVVQHNDGALLTWSVVSDEDIDYFKVYQRSVGTDRFALLQTISLPSLPFTGGTYEAFDAHPERGQTTFYKIAIVLKGGRETSSTIQSISLPATVSDYTVYPMPPSDYIHIRRSGTGTEETTLVVITSLEGRKWKETLLDWRRADREQTIDIRHYPRGMYLLHIIEGSKSTVVPFTIQR